MTYTIGVTFDVGTGTVDALVEYTYRPGRPARPASLEQPGEPPEPPEAQIVSLTVGGAPAPQWFLDAVRDCAIDCIEENHKP